MTFVESVCAACQSQAGQNLEAEHTQLLGTKFCAINKQILLNGSWKEVSFLTSKDPIKTCLLQPTILLLNSGEPLMYQLSHMGFLGLGTWQ